MTRSSRRMDRIAGRPKWTATDKNCMECGGDMVQLIVVSPREGVTRFFKDRIMQLRMKLK